MKEPEAQQPRTVAMTCTQPDPVEPGGAGLETLGQQDVAQHDPRDRDHSHVLYPRLATTASTSTTITIRHRTIAQGGRNARGGTADAPGGRPPPFPPLPRLAAAPLERPRLATAFSSDQDYSFSTDVGARRLLSRRLAASAPGGARTSRRDSARRGRGATG